MRQTLLAAAFLLGITPSAYSATLRHDIVLHGDKVHLSDLFDDLPPSLDTTLGDAPEPGKSYDVSGPQLTAIAAQYGVDWPDASPRVSITLTRGAHIFGRTYALRLLQNALHIAPNDPDATIELNPFKSIIVPIENTERPTLTRLESHSDGKGAFSARLLLDGPDPIQVPLSGAVMRRVDAIALVHAVPRGQPIVADNIEVIRLRADQVPDGALQSPEEAAGYLARTALPASRPITTDQIVHPLLVRAKAPVVMTIASPSLRVTASGVALESGSRNDLVRVLNPTTRMVVTGRVTERSTVEILPGSSPVPMDGRTLTASRRL